MLSAALPPALAAGSLAVGVDVSPPLQAASTSATTARSAVHRKCLNIQFLLKLLGDGAPKRNPGKVGRII
jgi:hypothetical protein